MKHLPILLALACLSLAGCEQPISEQEQNQPVKPATFSLVGKKYVCEGSNPSIGLDYVADVLYFFSADSMVYYSTEYKDFELDKALHSDYAQYLLNGYNIRLVWGDTSYIKIKNEDVLLWESTQREFKLKKVVHYLTILRMLSEPLYSCPFDNPEDVVGSPAMITCCVPPPAPVYNLK